MKYCFFLLCVLLVNCYSWGQEFPKGSWIIVSDTKGNFLDPKNAETGPRQVTNFDFQEGVKYSFSFEEYDSAGRKIFTIKEHGVYSFTSALFVLTPATSTTIYYNYLPQSAKPIGNSEKQNPLVSASYRWIYQREKDEKLIIEALNPGYREGFVSGGANTKKKVSKPDSHPMEAVRQHVKEIL